MADPRYSRQEILTIFEPGDYKKIRNSTVAVIGVGGTGSLAAELFVRAGIKKLVIVDRDYVSISNLHRQILFDDDDIGEPKVQVARAKLQRMNPDVDIEALETTLDASNAEEIVKVADLVYDGTDNFTTRLILNDACVKFGKPWIYTSAIETYGEVKAVIPGVTSCLSCYMAMPDRRQPACSDVGVFPSVPSMVSSFGFTRAIRILLGREENGNLYFFDPWNGDAQSLSIKRNINCNVCSTRNFEFLGEKYRSLGIRPLV